MNSIELTNNLIDRAKNLQEFTVSITLPEDFRFNGLVPFDFSANGNKAKIKVFAINVDEANDKVSEWLETCK
jgi:hypothetical protein